MPGLVALIGAGTSLAAMAELERELLAATGCARPRAVILAAGVAGSGEAATREAQVIAARLELMGAEVEPMVLPDRLSAGDDAAIQAVGEADLIYLANGSARHLCITFDGTPLGAVLGEASRRGAVLVSSGAGAGVLAARHPTRPAGFLPWPLGWCPAAGLLPDTVVLPDYDRGPEALAALLVLQVPRGSAVLGLDRASALVGRDGAWQVRGSGRVTVWQGRHRRRYRAGDVFRI